MWFVWTSPPPPPPRTHTHTHTHTPTPKHTHNLTNVYIYYYFPDDFAPNISDFRTHSEIMLFNVYTHQQLLTVHFCLVCMWLHDNQNLLTTDCESGSTVSAYLSCNSIFRTGWCGLMNYIIEPSHCHVVKSGPIGPSKTQVRLVIGYTVHKTSTQHVVQMQIWITIIPFLAAWANLFMCLV